MKLLPIPACWLPPAAFRTVIHLLIARSAHRLWANCRATEDNLADLWWMETKRQIDRDYDRFCRRRNLDPNAVEWRTVINGAARHGEAMRAAAA